MYWSNSISSGPRLERATLGGSGRRTIVTGDVGQVSSLAIDYVGRHLYWVSVERGCIEMSDMLGGSRRQLIGQLQQPFGIALYGDNVYWTDWTSRTIERADRLTGSRRTVVRSRVDFPMDLAVFSVSRQQGNKTKMKARHLFYTCYLLSDGQPFNNNSLFEPVDIFNVCID